jgi:iron complex transport system substrate-binding protein
MKRGFESGFRWVWLLLVALAVGVGCQDQASQRPTTTRGGEQPGATQAASTGDPAKTAEPADPAYPLEVADSAGYTLRLAQRPRRIVSTAPSNTEIIFAVGAGEQLVGVTTYCNYPPEAKQREKIGGFSPKSISIESIVNLKPDLVLTTGGIQQPLTASLRQVRLPVLSYDADTLDGVIENVRRIGRACGRAREAEALASKLQERLAATRARAATRKTAGPRVLLLLSEEPLMTVGPKTFLGQMLELAGGRNIFADVTQQYPRISEEQIIQRNPEVIVLWDGGNAAARRQQLANRPGWGQLEAVRQQRLPAINEDLISRPTPRLFDGLDELTRALESFGQLPPTSSP